MLNALSIVGYFGMVGGFAALLLTRNLFSTSQFVVSVQAVALLLLLWARAAFGRRSFHVAANPTEGGLVTGGPYRYVRHPIYTALCLFTLPGVIAHQSWKTNLCGALVLGCAVIRISCEEILIAARYPEYRQYASTTWRMIPYIF